MERKELALEAAEHAITLYFDGKDPMSGPGLKENLAFIQATFGENSSAISFSPSCYKHLITAGSTARPLHRLFLGLIRSGTLCAPIPLSKNSARKAEIISPTSLRLRRGRPRITRLRRDNTDIGHSKRFGRARPRCCKSDDNCRASVSDANRNPSRRAPIRDIRVIRSSEVFSIFPRNLTRLYALPQVKGQK